MVFSERLVFDLIKRNRWLRWVFVSLFIFEIAYVIGTTVFLNGGFLPRLINTDESSLRVMFSSAFSPFPGYVIARALELRIQDSNVQLAFKIDRVHLWVNVALLFQRELSIPSAKLQSVVFYLRRKRSSKDILPIYSISLPPIPGLANFLKTPPTPDSGKEPWHVNVTNVAIGDLHEVWIEEFRFRGEAEAGGGFFLRPGKEALIRPSYVRALEGGISVAGKELAEGVSIDIEAEIEHFLSNAVPGLKLGDYVTGRIKADAKRAEFNVLKYYLHRLPWLDIQGKTQRLHADISIVKGSLQSGTQVHLDSNAIDVRFGKNTARGSGKVDWGIVQKEARPWTKLELQLPNYEIIHNNNGAKIIGRSLKLEVASPNVRLSDNFSNLLLHLEIPEAAITHLSYFNPFFPRSSHIEFVGGSGTVQADFTASTGDEKQDRGKILLQSHQAVIRHKKTQVAGDVSLAIALNRGNTTTGEFDISGTEVTLKNLSATTSQNNSEWWGKAVVSPAMFSLKSTHLLRGHLAFTAKDTKPLLALVSSDGGISHFIQSQLNFEGLSGRANFRLSDEEVSVSDGVISGKGASVVGWFQEFPTFHHGMFLFHVGPIAAGLELTNNGERVILKDSSLWFHAHLPVR